MEILGKLLGGQARVKIMRLFLLNRNKGFFSKDIAKRTRVPASSVAKEIRLLSSVGFIKKKNSGWFFDSLFKYTDELEGLLINSDTLDKEVILNTFKRAGRLKLLAVSGIFLKDKDSRVDILLVGDRMKRGKIEEGIKRLEAEIGAELTYAVFETKEFTYRLNMYDKLVRDILDFPHEIIFQVRELSTQALKKV